LNIQLLAKTRTVDCSSFNRLLVIDILLGVDCIILNRELDN